VKEAEFIRHMMPSGTMSGVLKLAPNVDSSGAMDKFAESDCATAMLWSADSRTQE
jgi:hypothetical protein